ncbi:aminotransferase class V-fold PLP-dependent enzyme [Fulvivirga sp.]|uniref:aminotransferase class V-fold PLP-dependent enzyme n=1 Tax=Fulvivirga sp. TaxID=1931237 RepID=UPI0032EE44E1
MLSCQKELFSLNGEATYINCAYMSPLLKSVEKAGVKGIEGKRNPISVTPDDFFKNTELLRAEYSKLINSDDPKRSVVIPSVSYGISTAAKNIKVKVGQKIIVLAEQFPSNYYPWKRLCDENGAQLVVVNAPKSTDRGQAWNEAILNSIDGSTAAVAMAHVHWADGTKFDLEAIRKKTNEVGALLIIDGTQSIGALPFDVQKIKPDALICAGYKWLLGPYSIGLGYFGEAFDNGVPLEENWINRFESENFAGLVNYNDDYQHGALRYEVGEHSNFILVPMLLESIRQINQWGVENIQEYCKQLFAEANTALMNHGYTIESEKYRGHHLFGIRSADTSRMEKLKVKLSENKISVSVRGDAIRVSPHLYNDSNDVQKFVDILTSI